MYKKGASQGLSFAGGGGGGGQGRIEVACGRGGLVCPPRKDIFSIWGENFEKLAQFVRILKEIGLI